MEGLKRGGLAGQLDTAVPRRDSTYLLLTYYLLPTYGPVQLTGQTSDFENSHPRGRGRGILSSLFSRMEGLKRDGLAGQLDTAVPRRGSTYFLLTSVRSCRRGFDAAYRGTRTYRGAEL